MLIGSAVANTTGADSGDGRLNGVTVRSINDDGELTSGIEQIACDLLAVSGGWSPLVHLHSQRQGKLRWDDELAAFVPSTVVPNQQIIGAGRGSFELDGLPGRGHLRRSGGGHRRRLRPRKRRRSRRSAGLFGAEGVRPDPPAVAGPRPGRHPG